jgi:hypothetical protein
MDKVHKQKPRIRLKRLPTIPSLPNRKEQTKFKRFFEWKDKGLVTKHELKKLLSSSERHINEDLLKDSELIIDKLVEMEERVESKLGEIQRLAQDSRLEMDQGLSQYQEQIRTIRQDICALSQKSIEQVKPGQDADIDRLQEQLSRLNQLRANDRALLEEAFERLESRLAEEIEKIIGWINFFNENLK